MKTLSLTDYLILEKQYRTLFKIANAATEKSISKGALKRFLNDPKNQPKNVIFDSGEQTQKD